MKSMLLLNCGIVVHYSKEDEDLILKYTWHTDSDGYLRTNIKGKPQRLHNMIAQRIRIVADRIDHVDFNILNNSRTNLRGSSFSESEAHKRPPRAGHEYKGVRQKASGKWEARIKANGEEQHIGTFATEIQAALAYDQEAKKRFGEFAVLNFSEE